MLEQARVPFGAERFQREIMVTPSVKESHRTHTQPKYGRVSDSPVKKLYHRPPVYSPKKKIVELENRRKELFTLALEAIARAQEARDRCARAENKLEQETNQRLVAEKRLKELELDRLRQLQAVKLEGFKTLRAVRAHGEAEARLKLAEGRIKEAENDARSLTLALARADQKRAEAEATARAEREKAHKIESLYLGMEDEPKEAIHRRLIFGLLVFANKRQETWGMEWALRSAEEKRRKLGANLKRPTQKQNPNTQPGHDQESYAGDEFTYYDWLKFNDDKKTNRLTEHNQLWVNPKFIVYSMVITLLVGVVWLLSAA